MYLDSKVKQFIIYQAQGGMQQNYVYYGRLVHTKVNYFKLLEIFKTKKTPILDKVRLSNLIFSSITEIFEPKNK